MIEQHRELAVPGTGITRDPGPTKEYEEFPRYMTHPAYSRGKGDQEIKVLDDRGQPTGRLIYTGGESIRFPPVLAKTPAQRDEHLSYGYVDNGKCDAAAFSRLVADSEPVPENYDPLEYPKYVYGKIVNNAAEAEERLIELNVNADGSPREAPITVPQIDIPPEATSEASGTAPTPEGDDEDIEALEAKLAALKAKRAAPEQENTTITEAVAAEASSAPDDKAAKTAARVAKMVATKAKKKAEQAA